MLRANIVVMKSKLYLWGGVLILVAGLAAAVAWWLLQPQTLTLANGAKLTLVAVTYGQHHKSPILKSLDRPHQSKGRFDGTNDFLVVWIRQQHNPNQWPLNYQLFAYDRAATACVGSSSTTGNANRRQGDEIVGFRFDAFPRRQRKFELRVQEFTPRIGWQMRTNAFVISNPARGPFPTWYPNSLPDTESDGDLDVTLTKLASGAKTLYQRGGLRPDDPLNQGVMAGLQIQQNDHDAANWQPVQVVTSDATGNRVTAPVNNFGQGTGRVELYQYGLWPDEPAWKVRFEFSRESGFTENELWTAQKVPIQPGQLQDFWRFGHNRANPPFAETTVKGWHVKVFPAMQFSQPGGWGQLAGGIEVQADPPPEGMRLTLVKVTDDQGQEVPTVNAFSPGGGSYRFGLRDFGDAKSLNLTLALHQSRFIEFTAKPGPAPSRPPPDTNP